MSCLRLGFARCTVSMRDTRAPSLSRYLPRSTQAIQVLLSRRSSFGTSAAPPAAAAAALRPLRLPPRRPSRLLQRHPVTPCQTTPWSVHFSGATAAVGLSRDISATTTPSSHRGVTPWHGVPVPLSTRSEAPRHATPRPRHGMVWIRPGIPLNYLHPPGANRAAAAARPRACSLPVSSLSTTPLAILCPDRAMAGGGGGRHRGGGAGLEGWGRGGIGRAAAAPDSQAGPAAAPDRDRPF